MSSKSEDRLRLLTAVTLVAAEGANLVRLTNDRPSALRLACRNAVVAGSAGAVLGGGGAAAYTTLEGREDVLETTIETSILASLGAAFTAAVGTLVWCARR